MENQADPGNLIGHQFAASARALSVAAHPLMLAFGDFGKSCAAFLAAVKGKAIQGRGRIFFVADDNGNVNFSGYAENLDWLHGLLELRYGPALVSPIEEGAVRFFIFKQDDAWRLHPRWNMYAGIPETGDPRLRETDYYSHS